MKSELFTSGACKDSHILILQPQTLQGLDAINNIFNIPLLISKLDAFESKVEDVMRIIQFKEEKPSSNLEKTVDWKSRQLVSLKEAAVILDQSERTVKNLVKRGLLEESKATRHRKITTRSLIAYVDRTV